MKKLIHAAAMAAGIATLAATGLQAQSKTTPQKIEIGRAHV